MVPYGNIIFASAIVEKHLRKTPVAAEADETATVDKQAEALGRTVRLVSAPLEAFCRDIAVNRVVHLADSRFERDLVGNAAVNNEGETDVVEVLLSVTLRPPKPGMVKMDGRNLDGPGLARGEGLGELEGRVAEGATERALDAPGGIVDQRHLRIDLGGSGVRQRQDRADKGILDADCALVGDIDIVPDADIAAADRRDPVPADGRVHRGIVCADNAAVLVGTVCGLFLDGPVMDVLMDEDCEVVTAFLQDAGDIELSLAESPFDTAERYTVQVYVGLPVDPVEMQELTLGIDVSIECVTIPERRTEI